MDTLPEIKGRAKYKINFSRNKIISKLKAFTKVKAIESISYIAAVIKVDIESSDLVQIKSIEGVRSITPEIEYSRLLPIQELQQNNMYNRFSSIYTGKNIKVGIVDTGIDTNHPALHNRILHCKDFTKALNNCTDEISHGTHVAGIIASTSVNHTGVSPDVLLGIYRVFAAKGGASHFSILQALDEAAKDKMDIINLSLGTPSGWDGGILEKAIKVLYEQQIIICGASGNDGRDTLFVLSSPAISPYAIAVRSVNHDSIPSNFSSQGLGPLMEVKPDVMAPNKYIYS